ncbi:MAG: MEKHLA domain-containing protein [Gammaproteobacteria bacterium]|nr:MEKHLA domain-containing protein [Gammaproteobacteria bacterium]
MSNASHDAPCKDNDYLSRHIQLLRFSHKKITGQDMVNVSLSEVEAAKKVYYSPSVVLSHDTQTDPVLNYVNQAGLKLFELDWSQMLTMPSRLTAEPMERGERQALLDKVSGQGYINDYTGVRISSTGRRFKIENATVWNLVDTSDNYRGQAAMFRNWEYLE